MSDSAHAPDRLLNAREVAALLAVPESWVREQTRSGRLPHLALGRYRRYERQAILDWVETHQLGGDLSRARVPERSG